MVTWKFPPPWLPRQATLYQLSGRRRDGRRVGSSATFPSCGWRRVPGGAAYCSAGCSLCSEVGERREVQVEVEGEVGAVVGWRWWWCMVGCLAGCRRRQPCVGPGGRVRMPPARSAVSCLIQSVGEFKGRKAEVAGGRDGRREVARWRGEG